MITSSNKLGLLGLNCFLAEYRGYGASTGTPLMGTMLGDVDTLLEVLGLPPEERVLFGRSVGSIYAIHGASFFGNIAGLVIESGIADCLARLLMRIHPAELGRTHDVLSREVDTDLNHRRKMEIYSGPTLVMHTRQNGLVDVSQGKRLHQWAAGSKVFKIFERGNHNSIMAENFTEYLVTQQDFLRKM